MEAGSLAERSCVGATTTAREAVGVMEASARVCRTIGLRHYGKKGIKAKRMLRIMGTKAKW
jgi:hypothetical protein